MFNLHCVVIIAGGLHKAFPFEFILTKTSIIIINQFQFIAIHQLSLLIIIFLKQFFTP